jgi:hypothetical protein
MNQKIALLFIFVVGKNNINVLILKLKNINHEKILYMVVLLVIGWNNDVLKFAKNLEIIISY